jgi:hypothetical protein
MRFGTLDGDVEILAALIGITVTGIELVTPEPSLADIITFAVPNATPVTKPLALTVATPELDEE